MQHRATPLRTWIGLAIVIASQAATLARVEPFHSWHTPVAWTGYILFADGLVWRMRGDSWLTRSGPEFAFLAAVSVPLWLVFELYNTYALGNWQYVGLPESPALRGFGYAWAFATIWPGIFQTGELVACLRARGSTALQAPAPTRESPGPLGWASVAAGAMMLIGPLLYPSPYLAAPVFLGFIFLLDPLNARAGAESIMGDFRRGRSDRLINLLAAGLICGVLWEAWNYRAGAKWLYSVPILPDVRVFEMPILGYGGFPAFAVECFTMYVAVRRWIWRGAGRPVSR